MVSKLILLLIASSVSTSGCVTQVFDNNSLSEASPFEKGKKVSNTYDNFIMNAASFLLDDRFVVTAL